MIIALCKQGHFMIYAGVFCAMLFMGSCSSKREIVLRETRFTVKETKDVVLISPPLHREHSRLSILLDIDEPWDPVPPYKQIQLKNGQMATLEVTLVSEAGVEYEPDIYGFTGGMLSARFDEKIPMSDAIVKCQLSSDTKITVKRIVWHEYTGK